MFICPACGAHSTSPADALEGYCGRCHTWTGAHGDVYRARHLGSTDPAEFTAACLERALYEEAHGGNWTTSMLGDLLGFRGDKRQLAALNPGQWGELLDAGFDATNAGVIALGWPPLRRDPYA